MSSINNLTEKLALLRGARANLAQSISVMEEQYEELNIQIEETLEEIQKQKS